MKKSLITLVVILFASTCYAQSWSTTGNSGTSSGTNFVGTTDNQALTLKVNDTVSGYIHPSNGLTGLGFSVFKNGSGGTNITSLGIYNYSANSSGSNNTGIGAWTSAYNTSGNYNNSLGINAFFYNTTGGFNFGAGPQALFYNTSGNLNTSLGSASSKYNTTGSHNTVLGERAFYSNSTGDFNVAIGESALYANTSGSNNIAIGTSAGSNLTTGSNNIIIGNNISITDGTLSNQLVIGNNDKAWISGNNGEIGIPGNLNVGLSITANGTVPSGQDIWSYPALWLGTRASSVISDNYYPDYPTNALAINMTRNDWFEGFSYDLADYSVPAWQVLIGGGDIDYATIGRSSAGGFNFQYNFGLTGGGNISVYPGVKVQSDGTTFLGGTQSDLNPANNDLSFLGNSGKLLIGVNRTTTDGETDFVANQGTGNSGGYSFYNHNNSGVDTSLFRIKGNGNVGIGTNNPDTKLAVNGTIHSREVKLNLTGWPDYVFKSNYHLKNLNDLENYIGKYHHLPELPSAAEVEKNGLNLGEINKILLKKVEELTLYLIEKDNQVKLQQQKRKNLQKQIADLLDQINASMPKDLEHKN